MDDWPDHLPQPGTWRWRWFLAKYYINAFFYYLILGSYLAFKYPGPSWKYLKAVWPSWALIKKGIDIAWAKFLERFFPSV